VHLPHFEHHCRDLPRVTYQTDWPEAVRLASWVWVASEFNQSPDAGPIFVRERKRVLQAIRDKTGIA
jgi:hypothetical protein